MLDRSLRFLTFPQQSPQGGERGAVLLRERPSSPPDAPQSEGNGDDRRRDSQGRPGSEGSQQDNPFAPPPEGTPDQPWQPRHPSGDEGGDGSRGEGGRSLWGRQWSDRQPGRSSGGFGDRPRGPEGQGGGPQGPSGMRWDPTDPAQRRARYARASEAWWAAGVPAAVRLSRSPLSPAGQRPPRGWAPACRARGSPGSSPGPPSRGAPTARGASRGAAARTAEEAGPSCAR